ncbi:MAG: phage tail assembly chaperone [Rhodocyclaceae bacterium]|nr:phage tail assembly chaperone [Rhodocyclaceae bacterium]
MPKLKLTPNPTFQKDVDIHVPGESPCQVKFTFKHRTRAQLDAFIKSRPEKSDIESVMEMAEGWDLEDEFGKASLEKLIENYVGSPMAIYTTYIDELVKAKAKN